MFLGAGFNLIGAILRFVSSLQPIVCFAPFTNLGFAVAMIGQVLTACGQPFFLYSPAKLANTWFSRKERDVCTGLLSMGEWSSLSLAVIYPSNDALSLPSPLPFPANVVGLATCQLLAPQVVQKPGDLPTLVSSCRWTHPHVVKCSGACIEEM